MVKSVHVVEVTAQLHAIVRRLPSCAAGRKRPDVAELDLISRRAWLAGEPFDLTRNYFRLTRLLLNLPQRFLSGDELLEQHYN